jgi:hypothetical protein
MAFVVRIAAATVAVAFMLSASWKLLHPTNFRTQYLQVTPLRIHRFSSVASYALPALEVAVALCLLAPPPFANGAAFIALLLLAGLTPFASRLARGTGGCGCWRSSALPTKDSRPIVLRNLALGVCALLAITRPSGTGPAGWLASLVVGGVIAFTFLEIPSVMGVVHEVKEGARI